MLVAVIGGRLQGVEAVYLARKAGWETLLIDKTTGAPASGFCDRFVIGDVTDGKETWRAVRNAAMIIPALENDHTLAALKRLADREGIPLAHDAGAYDITSSKRKSNRLFSRMNLPIPAAWPSCDFPIVVKPDRNSGSRGVQVIRDLPQLENRFSRIEIPRDWVLQEFIQGPSYSLEVMGSPAGYRTLQVTDLFMDEGYDCKRVRAPTELPPEKVGELEAWTLQIAAEIRLRGIMDIEVVLANGALKILEIDARLPSQTPMTVFWSTGINMVQLLGDVFVKGGLGREIDRGSPRCVLVEHIRSSGGVLKACGEHIMGGAGPLEVLPGFFGADEAITSYRPGQEQWEATMIYAAETQQDLLHRRMKALEDIRREFALETFIDSAPEPVEYPETAS
jgi:pyrrolysine biosynthesis protein PylC